MKPAKWKKPEACVRWGLYDSAGELVLTTMAANRSWHPNRMWHRVNVTPIRRRKR